VGVSSSLLSLVSRAAAVLVIFNLLLVLRLDASAVNRTHPIEEILSSFEGAVRVYGF
jgi:hypothetical protein